MIRYEGRWAVVTGASSGLGRGLAARLAHRGMSLVLTGRNAARLDEAAEHIRRAAPRVEEGHVHCAHMFPSGVLELENTPLRWKAGQPIRVYAVDL
jgi:NADP-dependent 3-hydroxy acid dehydrogenase YdfG